jgi:hypothetical protein
MKNYKFLFVFISLFLIYSCEETTIYQTDPALTNDAFHGAVSGKILQKESGAKITVSQEKIIDSTSVNVSDGTFRIEELPLGNYDLRVEAENYRIYNYHNIAVNGGGTTYLGILDLSTVPDLVSGHYPEDKDEIVFDPRSSSLTISLQFTQPMDRESVEEAFSTQPATEGIFFWGNYTSSPTDLYWVNTADRSSSGATITTYSKITSFTYRMSQKDCFTDTTYNVQLSTSAKDTAGNFLRFPLEFSFSTVQSATSLNGIQTVPYHGDIDIDLENSGIQIIFPRRMNQESVESNLTISPGSDLIYIWPEKNQLTIYTGGAFMADTLYSVQIDSLAEDMDGIKMGNQFSFYFTTSEITVKSSSPRNGELFVPNNSEITIWFNTYMTKSSVQNAFSISPAINGTFYWGTIYNNRDKTAITFTPSGNFLDNTKYEVIISTEAEDLFGSKLPEAYTISFVTRPE